MDNDMFSNLTQILQPAIRRAEETDTHQYIRQQERDQNRKRQQRDKEEDSGFDMNDQASVSLDALATFIVNMLENAPRPSTASPETSDITAADRPLDHAAIPQQTAPVNPASAQAASAYSHAAQTAPPQRTTPQTAAPKDRADTLLNQILKDIDLLRARGVTHITIERADTFEQSLLQALERAKSHNMGT